MSYVQMNHSGDPAQISAENSTAMLSPNLSPHEVYRLRQLLQASPNQLMALAAAASSESKDTDADSEYSEFPETTHAWAVFADKTNRKATKTDRIVGTAIIFFQLFTYGLFVVEAIEDYQSGTVPILTTHDQCLASGQQPNEEILQCEADVTNHFDACVAFFMLRYERISDCLCIIRGAFDFRFVSDG